MKYLRKFFESSGDSNKKWELLKFCNENLVYLLDEGFDVFINDFEECYVIFITLKRKPFDFYWKDIKNDFIPFFEFLKSKYSIIKPLSTESSSQSDIIMFVTEPTSYSKWKSEKIFYNESQLLSGKCSNRRMSNIQIFINKNTNI
jgi:hypothetical protein